MLDTMPMPGGYLMYALSLLAVWAGFALIWWAKERRAAVRHLAAGGDGTAEPASLHPVIDPSRCIGCGACTHACPEGKIIGLIGGKATLLDPTSCIGHGACQTACPTGAIDLVFGSARRGVEIPFVSANFESNVPGLFIAGELGGMGLIANAVEQGRQAIDTIAKSERIGNPKIHDVIIVGGGPAGLAASLAAKQHGLRALTLEQDALGGTVARYPRGKIVMTRPAELPLYGRLKLRRVRKEKLLALWHDVIGKTGVQIHHGVRVHRVTPRNWGFDVETSQGRVAGATVLLATGRRGSPRRLGVPGEHLTKVVYSLDDAAQYTGHHVLVVGGGDSALETALELARHRAASVTLSYRGTAFNRARPDNRQRIEAAIAHKRVNFLPASQVAAIEPAEVVIDQNRQRFAWRNDAVIICAGGLLPTSLLADIGVQIETKYGTV